MKIAATPFCSVKKSSGAAKVFGEPLMQRRTFNEKVSYLPLICIVSDDTPSGSVLSLRDNHSGKRSDRSDYRH